MTKALSTKDHAQWNRELLTQAYEKLQSKCYQAFSKDLSELDDEETRQVIAYLKQETHPVIKALYQELIKEV